MRTVSRVLLSIFALCSVGVLGYYAFALSFGTIVPAFHGSQDQQGSSLLLVAEHPTHFFGTPSPTFDVDALRSSLLFGTQSLLDVPTLSGEYQISVSGEVASVFLRLKKSESLTLSADLYNKNKKTKYRLSKDIHLNASDIPQSLQIGTFGEPRDQQYKVKMYGFDSLSPDDIRYFVHYQTGSSCDLVNAWNLMKPVKTHALPITKEGQIASTTVKVDFDITQPRVCIIAGLGGVFTVVEDRSLPDFSIVPATLQVLSPELGMKSQIEMRFSSPLYMDTGALYSSEYIARRTQAKIDLLKHLDISPGLSPTPSDLILSPDRAILTLPLGEGKKYTFSLKNISDIYGREQSLSYDITPKKEPFLSLKLRESTSLYAPGKKIPADLYALAPAQKGYSLKLCRVAIDPYARLERIISEADKKYENDIFSILGSQRESSGCTKKDIAISNTGYVSSFDVTDLAPGGKLETGMYVLYFADPSAVSSFSRLVKPIVFSVVDTHIVLKSDVSGQMMILATDLSTGTPLAGQEITVMRNIERTYTETYDPNTQTNQKQYLPLAAQSFATGIILGKTDDSGFLQVQLDTLKALSGYDSSPYSLSFENWWEYEGRYDSFLVQSRSEGHFGLVVSTWNDGITGYNFGIPDSDYSYQSRGTYTSYLHTDRRLYKPGEKVFLHAIVRTQGKGGLLAPVSTPFSLIVTDPLGKEIKNTPLNTNAFGSISTDLVIPSDAPLGSYNVTIVSPTGTEFIENSYTSFQVEIFKNPTFTPTVTLKSNDLEDGVIKVLKKTENKNPNFPWYTDAYVGDFGIDAVVKSSYYNGALMKNMPFKYRIYRSEHYEDDYFSDCFWGCYYETPIEFYTEGTGQIDAEGYGIFHAPIVYTSYASDYTYTVEVTLRDPFTGEEVTTPSTLLVQLPAAYKSFSIDNPLVFTPKKKILTSSEDLSGIFAPKYGKWDTHMGMKYRYELVHRSYEENLVDDIRAGSVRITTPVDHIVASGSIADPTWTHKLLGYKPGEYHLRVIPVTTGVVPESSISDTIFYISGDLTTLKDSHLRVIPDRTTYQIGDTAHVLIQVPFTGSHLLITQEKGGIIHKEYRYLSGNTLMTDIRIDDSVLPNAYIGVVALHPDTDASRTYAVGYGEIITDISEKKSRVQIVPDKTTYKNRETVQADITLTDTSGNPLSGEVTVMVVDESLIRLLGNIDLDIIPKFFQKFPFTVKTSLSAIGIERNRFLSRKGSNGGGGDKGGGGAQIASRTLFQNTAYYNPSILTDASGRAHISFALPDNISDYRIIAIANTLDSHFGVGEKTIQVRKDYLVEAHAPQIIRTGDTFTLMVNAFNNSKKITAAELSLRIGSGADMITQKSELILNTGEGTGSAFLITVPKSWTQDIPYTVELREKGMLLDSLSQSITLASLPIIENTSHITRIFSGTTLTLGLPAPIKNTDLASSRVRLDFSPYRASELVTSFDSLLQYPYGCIEQTIGSTLPNIFALNFSDALHIPIDREKATKNRDDGLAKILRMQHPSGGWVYWEGNTDADTHITPYVLRSLFSLRDLGIGIPQSVLDAGVGYIVSNQSVYAGDPDGFAEAVWTLALLGHPSAREWFLGIDTNKLSRHGYLAYAYSAHLLKLTTPQITQTLSVFMKDTKNQSYWYWDRDADLAIYARLLMDQGSNDAAQSIISTLLLHIDPASYYVSTQSKLQLFLTLARDIRNQKNTLTDQSFALRGDALISDVRLSSVSPLFHIDTTREKLGLSYTLTRDETTPPIFVTMTTRDRPKNIIDMLPMSTGGIDVTRTFDRIDESRGIDADGNFIVADRVTDGVFYRGSLYRVTLQLTRDTDGPYQMLSLEDFFPGGWRPILGNMKTESQLEGQQSQGGWWDHIEARDDRLLANMSYGFEKTQTYVYYIRPESVGEYLLPPATAYLMYHPSVHAYTRYEKVKVVE